MIRALPYTFCVLVAGEVMAPIAPNVGALTQLGAVGVLSWIAYSQHQEQKSLRKTMHDDSAKLNDTLRVMAGQCATVQESLKQNQNQD